MVIYPEAGWRQLVELTCAAALVAVACGASFAAAEPAGASAARYDLWKVIGMGGGGTMQFPAISPHSSDVILEACDMTGGYISIDGGKSYRMFNLRTGVRCYAFDPTKSNVIYAGNDGLWRSEDSGRTWSLLLPDPAKNTVEHCRTDHGDHVFTTDDPGYPSAIEEATITAIAVDPRNSKTIYAAFDGGYGGKAKPSLVMSNTYGKSWAKVRDVDAEDIMWLDVDGKTGVVTLATTAGAAVLAGEKYEMYPAPQGVKFADTAIGRTADGKLVMYATGDASWKNGALAGGIYVSLDNGQTWRETAGSLGKLIAKSAKDGVGELHAIATSAKHAETAYVGFRDLELTDGPCNGIAKTTDLGITWTIVKKEGTAPSANAMISWIEPRMRRDNGNIWFDAPRNLAVAPTDASVCYATDLFRTCRTTDGGKWWETVTSAKVSDDKWATRGLDVTTCYGVHFDPFDAKNMYITYTDMGMFRSDDAGKSWTSSIKGIPTDWENTTYWLVFDPKVKGLAWGVFSGYHDLPRPKMWRQRDPGQFDGGISVTTDGCKTWTRSDSGIKGSSMTHILLDPASPVGKRTLYACGFGKGVFKSTDNGKTWELKNTGIAGKQPFAWRITRANDGTLYLVVARRSWKGEIGDENDGALYRSTDGAEHWEKMTLPEGCNGPNGLTLDPTDEKRMYLAAWGKMNQHAADTGGGIWLSTDAGETWRNVKSDDQHIYDVTIDARNGTLYACGFESAAYRSTDKGATWTRLKGYNFKWGHRVIPDPATLEMVYITTFGGSVWHGPAAGDPNATDDIITPIRKEP